MFEPREIYFGVRLNLNEILTNKNLKQRMSRQKKAKYEPSHAID